MGYPMTYQRVINRNGLATGGYAGEPPTWHATAPTVYWLAVHEENLRTFAETLVKDWADAAERHNSKVRTFMGDLRRLESDTTDEGATTQHIARRTGIDPEVVAAVLKEFIAW